MKTKIRVEDFFREWTGTRPDLNTAFHEAGIEAMAFAEAYHKAETKANGVEQSANKCNLQNVSQQSESCLAKCDVCGCHPSVIIRTEFGTFCQAHARYVR